MKRIGALWKGKEGSKAVLSGSLDLLGEEIKIGVFKNDKAEGNQPHYHIVRYSENNGSGRNPGEDDEQNGMPF